MKTPLFDVVISVAGDAETGEYGMTVSVVDRYHEPPREFRSSPEFQQLDAAIAWAKGAVTAFMAGTAA